MKKKAFEKLYEIGRFGLSGLAGLIVRYAILYLSYNHDGSGYVAMILIAGSADYTASFFMQKYWTFRNKNAGMIRKQMLMYFGIASIYFTLNILSICALVEHYHVDHVIAQLILTVLISIPSYFTSRMVFKQ